MYFILMYKVHVPSIKKLQHLAPITSYSYFIKLETTCYKNIKAPSAQRQSFEGWNALFSLKCACSCVQLKADVSVWKLTQSIFSSSSSIYGV